jgi:hypothetical protein
MKEYKDCNNKIVKVGDKLKIEAVTIGDCIMDVNLDTGEEVIRHYLDIDEYPEYVIAHFYPDVVFNYLKVEITGNIHDTPREGE